MLTIIAIMTRRSIQNSHVRAYSRASHLYACVYPSPVLVLGPSPRSSGVFGAKFVAVVGMAAHTHTHTRQCKWRRRGYVGQWHDPARNGLSARATPRGRHNGIKPQVIHKRHTRLLCLFANRVENFISSHTDTRSRTLTSFVVQWTETETET